MAGIKKSSNCRSCDRRASNNRIDRTRQSPSRGRSASVGHSTQNGHHPRPSSLCLIAIPFIPDLSAVIVLLLLRSLLSQIDVPTRTSYVMAVVTPPERPAAARLTAVPRSLAAAAEPAIFCRSRAPDGRC
jgi:hypothetical protein